MLNKSSFIIGTKENRLAFGCFNRCSASKSSGPNSCSFVPREGRAEQVLPSRAGYFAFFCFSSGIFSSLLTRFRADSPFGTHSVPSSRRKLVEGGGWFWGMPLFPPKRISNYRITRKGAPERREHPRAVFLRAQDTAYMAAVFPIFVWGSLTRPGRALVSR